MKKIILFILLIINIKVSANPLLSNSIEPAKYFINHDAELNNLSNKLSLYKRAGLLGISGMGKTQVARMYAFKNKEQYELIWFFDCNLDLNEQYLKLAQNINNTLLKNEDYKIPEDIEESKKGIKEYLGPKSNWLLVFDNLKVNQNNRLQDIIDWEHNGHVIIASQDAKNLLEVIPLPHLKQEDSVKLAKAILDSQNVSLVENLVETFKGYPVMVAQGAIFLNSNKHLTLDEYKQILAKSDNKIKAHMQLVLKELSPSAKNLLLRICLIDNHNFSKELLSKIALDEDSFTQDLFNISRFGLITSLNFNDSKEPYQFFEMHDVVKAAILEISGDKQIKHTVAEILDKINNLIKPGLSTAFGVAFESDKCLTNNLVNMLDNAEKYSANIYKIMETRNILTNFYLFKADYYNCKKMVEWLTGNFKKNNFKLFLMNDREKAAYSEYFSNVAVYKDFAESDYINAIKYFEQSIKIIDQVPGYNELKFTIYAELAQTQIFSGDTINGKLGIERVEKLVAANKGVKFDLELLYFIKSKLHILEGDKDKAAASAEKLKEVLTHITQDMSYSAAAYLMIAEVQNFIGNYQEAYDISKRIYDQQKQEIAEDHEMHARALRQLSRAERGLGDLEAAITHAKKAEEIYINDKFRENSNLLISHDLDLANSFMMQADAQAALSLFKEAQEAYLIAEKIYYNVYRDKMKNLDEVSYLYWALAKTSMNLSDVKSYRDFLDQHIRLFGATHPRSKDLISIEKTR